jgi:4-methylaminobutanoate oxidase (formaldehyde-forming)
MVVTGHPSQSRDQAHIRAHADPDWRFEVFDATGANGLLTLHGPASRSILQALSGDDLSNAAFPFGAAREIDLAHSRVWAIRRSFLGELGYELLIPVEFTAHVYEALLRQGAAYGLRHAGMFALGACRLEKGFRHFGHDIAEEDTPFETGLGFAVALDKVDFVGRAALLAQKAEFGAATRDRAVAIRVPGATAEAGPYLIHNEPIWKDGALVGHVTSGGWGWRLGAMVGLATLHRAAGVTRDWIDAGGFAVQIAGQHYPVDAQLAPFYDPAGTIMRG